MSKVKLQLYESYEKEILYLQKQGKKLLQEIKRHETKMNQRKQQNLQPNLISLNKLNQMIKKLLRMLAFIDTYGYFQLINEPLSFTNQTFFYCVANQYYEDILQSFLLRVKGRVNQLQQNRFVDFVVE